MVKQWVWTFETAEELLLDFKGIAFVKMWVCAALSCPMGLVATVTPNV